MVANPVYDCSGSHPCLDFVNTVDRSSDRPWVDRLRTYGDLLTWCAAAGILPVEAGKLTRAARKRAGAADAALGRARELREALYRLFTALAVGTQPPAADLVRLNGELSRALAHSIVKRCGNTFAWAWHAGVADLALPLWPLAQAAAELLTSPARTLVKRCAGDNCLWLFLDQTKNHGRRWCNMKVCGNRAKVRRHRHQQAR